MSWTKKILFFLFGWIILLVPIIFIFELIFGGWLDDFDEWEKASKLNIIIDKTIDYDISNIYSNSSKTITYTRNQYGLRDNCGNPENVDILTIGGSTTDQRYIDNTETFQYRIQEKFKNNLSQEVCISNAGVDGHSTFGHLASFDIWFPLIPNLKPQFTMLNIGINDAGFRNEPNFGFDNLQHGIKPNLKWYLREKSAFYNLFREVRNFVFYGGHTMAYGGHKPYNPSAKDYTASNFSFKSKQTAQKNTELFSQRLKNLLSKVSELGSTPICVTQPHKFTFNDDNKFYGIENLYTYDGVSYNGLDYDLSIKLLNAEMKNLCESSKGYFFDVSSQKFYQEDFYDFVHMTPQGSERLAQYIFEFILINEIHKKLN